MKTEIECEAQGFERVYVQFKQVMVRGVPHTGYAWFNVHRKETITMVSPISEKLRESITAARTNDYTKDATTTALVVLQRMLTDHVVEWTAKNGDAFVKSETERLRNLLDSQNTAHTDAVALAKKLDMERADTAATLRNFIRTHSKAVQP